MAEPAQIACTLVNDDDVVVVVVIVVYDISCPLNCDFVLTICPYRSHTEGSWHP